MSDEAIHQIGIDELRTLDADQTTAALRAGRLDALLAGRNPGPPPDPQKPDDIVTRMARGARDEEPTPDDARQLGRDDLANMSESEIAAALAAGRFDDMLARR
jgi:hypothetical protein